MTLSTASRDLLWAFPGVVPGDVAIFVRDVGGEVLRAGAEDGTRIESSGDVTRVVLGPGRASIARDLDTDGIGLVVTFDRADEPILRPALESLLSAVAERERLGSDMESMQSGSLALLEEASMMGDTLPLLSTGETEREIASMGLKALVVAASVERALYLRYYPEVGTCEVVVQAVMDASGRQAVIRPYEGAEVFDWDTGVVARAIADQTACLYSVREHGPVEDPDAPERTAQRDVIAVPVVAGAETKALRLGVLLVMDKRANSYSDRDRLGSQETKLTVAFASMLGAVLGARKVAELGKQMDLAQEIQGQILPAGPVDVAGFDVAGAYETSGDVGGDYFDYLPMADGRTLVVVADVSGHNLASGMVMVSARATLKVLAKNKRSVAGIFNALAEDLFEDLTSTEQFITAAAAALRPGGQDVELVNAGHCDTVWLHAAEREVEELSGSGTILGFVSGIRFRSCKLGLQPGDVLLLYTDGVTEALNPAGEMFGEERLRSVLIESGSGSAQELLDAVFGSVADFVNSHRREDDITAVVIKALSRRE